MGYFIASIIAARRFISSRRDAVASYAPGVSILKSLKGLDPGMLDAFRSHCKQDYTGEYELLFGVSSLEEPAVAAVRELQAEFPQHSIRLIECPERLGSNGKVSTLAQMAPHAQHEFLLVNDSDITVSPQYLTRVMAHFAPVEAKQLHQPPKTVGLVTALYRGRAHGTLGSTLESLTIATDFMPSVLMARMLEGGLRYGLGSTLAVSRDALTSIGGFEAIADQLADDYELGERIFKMGYGIALSGEVVETSVPAYDWRGFCDHQLRWLRTVRDARPGGYAGLIFTQGLSLALLNVIASGVSLVSLWLLALCFFLRLSLAMTVGAEVLGDHQVLPSLWLLPVRDLVATGLWVGGFASNTVVWRGEKFEVRRGRLHRSSQM
ncbi:MAG: bacteriohopanetetrol glucosamine biosynthesis glycosyltransferase HpnI [Acidobacteria bacterium]|nr:bacteriohopanetetrol glucosamine biosynthesis glycosyltransferase HpnI [Acidobacteriota bacterium]